MSKRRKVKVPDFGGSRGAVPRADGDAALARRQAPARVQRAKPQATSAKSGRRGQ